MPSKPITCVGFASARTSQKSPIAAAESSIQCADRDVGDFSHPAHRIQQPEESGMASIPALDTMDAPHEVANPLSISANWVPIMSSFPRGFDYHPAASRPGPR
jgi:hypothetical protein